MSLQETIQSQVRDGIVAYIRNNPNLTLKEILEEASENEQELILGLTGADLVATKSARAPRKKNETASQPKPTRETAQRNADFLRWRNQQENGDVFTMSEICLSLDWQASAVRAAMQAVGGFEKQGAGRNTTYVLTADVGTPPDDAEVDENDDEEKAVA